MSDNYVFGKPVEITTPVRVATAEEGAVSCQGLLDRLRTEGSLKGYYGPPKIQLDAADMIDRLRAENESMLEALREAYTVLAFAFNRIHGLPRSRDTELANDIEKVRAKIEPVIAIRAAAKGE